MKYLAGYLFAFGWKSHLVLSHHFRPVHSTSIHFEIFLTICHFVCFVGLSFMFCNFSKKNRGKLFYLFVFRCISMNVKVKNYIPTFYSDASINSIRMLAGMGQNHFVTTFSFCMQLFVLSSSWLEINCLIKFAFSTSLFSLIYFPVKSVLLNIYF